MHVVDILSLSQYTACAILSSLTAAVLYEQQNSFYGLKPNTDYIIYYSPRLVLFTLMYDQEKLGCILCEVSNLNQEFDRSDTTANIILLKVMCTINPLHPHRFTFRGNMVFCFVGKFNIARYTQHIVMLFSIVAMVS